MGIACRALLVVLLAVLALVVPLSSLIEAASAPFVQPLSCAARHPLVVVYNAVPKSGSSTITDLILSLAQSRNFTVAKLEPRRDLFSEARCLPGYNLSIIDGSRESLVSIVSSAADAIRHFLSEGTRAVVIGHAPFAAVIDTRVAYINLIREPVAQCTSMFYYRQRERLRHELEVLRYLPMEERISPQPRARSEETFSGCVSRTGRPQQCNCTALGNLAFLIEGAFEECAKPRGNFLNSLSSAGALKRAQASVDKHISLVGILPEIGAFIDRLEHILPDFFAGAQAVYSKRAPQNVGRTSAGYVLPDAATRERILELRAVDAQMYAHVKARWDASVPCNQ
jgi:hypothetical protein